MVYVKLDAVTNFDGTDIGEVGTSAIAPLEFQTKECQQAYKELNKKEIKMDARKNFMKKNETPKRDATNPRDEFMKKQQPDAPKTDTIDPRERFMEKMA